MRQLSHDRAELVTRLATRTVGLIEREYPNSIRLTMTAPPEALVTPRAIHPAFFGCYDWHSAVHSHWQLVRALRFTDNSSLTEAATAAFDRTLTPTNAAIEMRWVAARPGFRDAVRHGLVADALPRTARLAGRSCVPLGRGADAARSTCHRTVPRLLRCADRADARWSPQPDGLLARPRVGHVCRAPPRRRRRRRPVLRAGHRRRPPARAVGRRLPVAGAVRGRPDATGAADRRVSRPGSSGSFPPGSTCCVRSRSSIRRTANSRTGPG